MISEILIEGSRLDLFDDIGAELNYAIDDIKDFASRNTNYSKTITLPGNANNNKVFGHIYNFASANNYFVSNPELPNVGYNFDPTKQAEAKIFVNKIQVFKGVLRLLEVRINDGAIEYECVVFGELGGFSAAIGNSLIEEMNNFNTYNEEWTKANVLASWDPSGAVASGIGVVYPLIDYGNCKHGSRDYHLDAFRPAFHVYEFMDSIIKNANYTYESAFFETPYFKSLVIPNNKALLEQLRQDLLDVRTFDSLLPTEGKIDFAIVNNLSLFETINDQDFKFIGQNGTLGKISIFGFPYLNRVGYFTLTVKQNTDTLYTETFTSTVDFQIFPVDLTIETTLDLNDNIKIEYSFGSVSFDCIIYPELSLKFISDYPQVTPAQEGDLLNMKDLLPRGIQQKDFFASVCRLFNLYVFEDAELSNHLLIEPYIDFYLKGAGFLKINDLGELLLHGEPGDPTGLLLLSDPSADSVDWSNKVDHSKEVSLKPMSELNARYFEFKYKEDDDYYNDEYQSRYNQTYADRREDSKYQFAEDSQNVEVIFSPSVLVKRTGDAKLCASIFSIEKGDGTNKEVSKDHNIRIMQFAYVSGVTAYHIKQVAAEGNGNLGGGSISYYGYAGHLDNPTEPTNDINFAIPNQVYFTLTTPYPSTNLFTAFWGDYIAEITSKDSKLLTCYLYLTVEDIFSLNFARLIYIDGALFRLNKIIDFNPAMPSTTKVELLRVLELTYAN
jgi:hypothetical protein